MKLILWVAITLITTHSLSQTWQNRASLPTQGRYSAVSFTINGKAYVGLGGSGSTYLNDFWEYNPTNDVWTEKASFPGSGLYASSGFSIGAKGYVCFGADNNNTGQNELWEYDPATDSWTEKQSFPGTARYGASSFVLGDTAFIGTGSYGNPNDYLSDFWMWVQSSNSWTQLTDYPGGNTNHATAFSLDGAGYLGTGKTGPSSVTSQFWRYNPSLNNWTSVSPFPESRMGTINFSVSNQVYVGTGFDLTNRHDDFYIFNPMANAWDPYPSSGLPIRHVSTSFVLNNAPYVCTGFATPTVLSDLWTLDKESSLNELEPFEVNIYPNPVGDYNSIQISTSLDSFELDLTDLAGKVICTYYFYGKTGTIDVSNLISGNYFLIIHGSTAQRTFKVFKN